ncbi:MAG: lytic transglycosylase domain-containing protein [Bryobacteraceae bacterium]|nr:lytic transglycosylase domain-containing protein [Bryobacteraceae bacterium]
MLMIELCLLAAEIAVLSNGFTMRVDRHEVRGDQIVLYTAAGETVMARSAVIEFESLPEERQPVVEPAVGPEPAKTPRELVRAAATRYGLPPEFVESVARAESAFDPKAVSHKGAIGLMQLMPATAKALGADPYDATQNAEAGAKHLRELLLKYQGDVRLALAAYNAGEGSVAKYGGVPPYRETQGYIERVLKNYRNSSGVNSAK